MPTRNRVGRVEILEPGAYWSSKGMVTITPYDVTLRDFLRQVERKIGTTKWHYRKANIVWHLVSDTMRHAELDGADKRKFEEIYDSARDGSAVFGIRIGRFIESNVGVCREQAILAHIALAHVGVETRMVTGSWERRPGDVNKHAWLEFVTPPPGREMILDPSMGLAYKDKAYKTRKADKKIQLVKPVLRE